ncbi:TolC family protein [Marinobacter fonticola]|uniref:TolC family protein n=1 Tax=Marinobacter fonticola TaxID=2603215 RepID=UPI0011E76E4F|nr:TolC family protein [Marinobacter fonticola]
MIRLAEIQVILVLLVAISSPSTAQSLEAVDQWIAEALANNAALGAQKSSIEVARAGVDSSDTWADPVFKYGIAPETLAGPNTVGHRFELSQQLPWPDQLSASRKAAEAEVIAARQDTQWRVRQLTASVKGAYAQWWFANEAIELHHETRALVEQLAKVSDQRLSYGVGSQSQMLRVQTELDTLDARLVELKADQARLAGKLIPLLGRRPTDSNLQLSLPPDTPLVSNGRNGMDHPMIEAAQAREAEARARLEIAETNRRPAFTASAGYNSLWADDSKRWMIGIGIRIPFSGQRQHSAVRKAAAEVSQHQWRTTQAHREWLASIADMKASVQAGYDRLDILNQRHLPNQRAHWEASLNELASGTGRLEDAINSARQLNGVKLARAAIIRDLYSARAGYEALLPMDTTDVSN